MYENTLIKRISLIFENLRCKEIIDFLNQWNIDKLKLLTLVIESKIGYDRLISDMECKKFIDDIEEHTVYTTAEYSELIMFISTMGDVNTKFNNGAAILNKFQVFHKMLYKTGTLVMKLLTDKPVEAIPVVNANTNSIVNPLFNPSEGAVMPAVGQPFIPSKVFPISTPIKVAEVASSPVQAVPEQEDGEMSLSSFLKSLATG
ncbi:MAG: hypothetical protein NVS3B19_20730 [Ginsengibacter sp.]